MIPPDLVPIRRTVTLASGAWETVQKLAHEHHLTENEALEALVRACPLDEAVRVAEQLASRRLNTPPHRRHAPVGCVIGGMTDDVTVKGHG